MEALAIPLLVMVGAMLALQAAANVQLSAAMASPFGASTLQLGIGTGVLLAVATMAGSLGAFDLLDEAEPWALVGGLGSAVYITAGILLFPRLGALVAVGLFIAGQMAASLALDGLGWLGVSQDVPGVAALGGAAAVAVGTWLIVRAQAGAGVLEEAARGRAGWLLLGLVAGAVLPLQGAINAELNAELDAAVSVGAFSFLVATVAMALALGSILAAGAPRPQVAPLRGVPWWGWLGGLCGATYVTSIFLLIPEIGAAPVVVLTVAGQQLASVAVDRYGLLRLPRRTISRRRLAGVGVLLAGVALITLG
jgi:bacterial/archaeal transporter family-2 protein